MRVSSNDEEISRIKVLCIGRCPIVVENGRDVFGAISIGVVLMGPGQLVIIRAVVEHDNGVAGR